MGLSPSGMQPFELDGSFVVCNGEIYGFEQFKEQLSEKYTFQSESDCEILLPLYREYKTDMFAMLDAEFACIIYDGETGEYIAARDPVGIRPLYYGFDEAGTLLLASEPKNLVGLAEAIMPFPPGHYYKNGEFICYCDIASSDTICHDDLETVYGQIHDKLVAGVKKRLVADAKGRISSFRRARFVTCMRHRSKGKRFANQDLRYRHERRCHRLKICETSRRLYWQ